MTTQTMQTRKEFRKNLMFTFLEFGVKSPLNLKSFEAIKAALELIIRGTSLSLYLNEDEDEIVTTSMENNEEKVVSLTLSGAIFVVDILMVMSTGSVSQVSLSGQSKSTSPLANQYLTSILQEYRFVEFEKAIRLICFLDALKCPQQIDMLSLLSGLESDLLTIYQKESGYGKKVEAALFYGHGFPRFYKEIFGPSIIYYSFTPHNVLRDRLNQAISLRDAPDTFVALVSVEESISVAHFFNPSSRAQSLAESREFSIPVNEQHLYRVCETPILGSVVNVFTPLRDSELVANACFCLELVPKIAMSPLGIDELKGSLSQVDVVLDQEKPSSTFELVYFDGSSVKEMVAVSKKAKTLLHFVHKIRFTHISQIYGILKSLRQAVVFNKLADSLFKHASDSSVVSGSSKARLLTWTPPKHFQFVFLLKRPPFRYVLDLHVDMNGSISVTVSESGGSVLQIDFSKSKDLTQGILECDGVKIINSVQALLLRG